MAIPTLCSYFCIVFLIVFIPVDATKKHKGPCEFLHKDLVRDIQRISLEPSKECKWIIQPEHISSDADIFLVFKEFLLHSGDILTVRQDNNTSIIFGPYSGYKEPFSILTGHKRVVIVLKTTTDITVFKRSLWAYYDARHKGREVKITTDKGSIMTPEYRPRVGKTSLKFRFSPLRSQKEKLSIIFAKYDLPYGSVVILNSEGGDGEYTTQPPDIIGAVTVTVNVTLNLQYPNQSIKFILEAVTADCSGGINLTDTGETKQVLEVKKLRDFSYPASPSEGIQCRWIIYGPQSRGSTLAMRVESLRLDTSTDHLVINDGGRKHSKTVLQTMLSNQQDKNVRSTDHRSSTNMLWISFTSSMMERDPDFKLSIALQNSSRLSVNPNVIPRPSSNTRKGKREIAWSNVDEHNNQGYPYYNPFKRVAFKERQ